MSPEWLISSYRDSRRRPELFAEFRKMEDSKKSEVVRKVMVIDPRVGSVLMTLVLHRAEYRSLFLFALANLDVSGVKHVLREANRTRGPRYIERQIRNLDEENINKIAYWLPEFDLQVPEVPGGT